MSKLPLQLNKSCFFKPLSCVTSIICGLLMSQDIWAATQGQWGSTSTATANITLTIPAQHNASNTARKSVTSPINGSSEAKRLAVAIHTIVNEVVTPSRCQHWADNLGQSARHFATENYQLRVLANNSQEHSLQQLFSEHCQNLNLSNTQTATATKSLADPATAYLIKPAAKTTTTVLIAPL